MSENYIYKFDLDSAKEAFRQGKLFDWALEYLRSEGWHEVLANQLIEKRPPIIEFTEYPLNNLNRTMGPENSMPVQEKMDLWEKRVNYLVEKIKQGRELPPLIVTDFGADLEIADGSHRQEAYIRSGIAKYWTIFFFTKPESKRLLTGV